MSRLHVLADKRPFEQIRTESGYWRGFYAWKRMYEGHPPEVRAITITHEDSMNDSLLIHTHHVTVIERGVRLRYIVAALVIGLLAFQVARVISYVWRLS